MSLKSFLTALAELVKTALFRRHASTRRLLPLILVAGVSLLFLLSVFRNVEWRWLPRAFGLGGEDGLAEEGITTGTDTLPEWRDGRQGTGFREPKIDSTSPYPVGETKPPGSNYTRALVMGRMSDQSVNWVDEKLTDMMEDKLLKPFIYIMDDPTAPLHPPQNKGHEGMAYLTYIIDFYDELADINIFMHYHESAWHNNELQYVESATMIRQLSPERVTREGYMNLRCHWDPGCPSWVHPGAISPDDDKREEVLIAASWSELFPHDPIPTVLAQPCCAQFAVSRTRIHELPRTRYIALRDWILHTSLEDYFSGRVFEYVWQFVFTASPVHCPSMSVCYCDGYGICFDGPERFDAWFETRHRKDELADELREWEAKAEQIAEWRREHGGDRPAEEAQLVVPEVGRDVWLRERIRRLDEDLVRELRLANQRGKTPHQRAKEAGRSYKDGDGF